MFGNAGVLRPNLVEIYSEEVEYYTLDQCDPEPDAVFKLENGFREQIESERLVEALHQQQCVASALEPGEG